jgi:hypothetical protein
MPDGTKWEDYISPTFEIKELHDPKFWINELGLEREKDKDGREVTMFADLHGLYRRKRYFQRERPWHHWIYASPTHPTQFKCGKFNSTDNPWDRTFQDLLNYRHENEAMGSYNFNYVTCPGSFFCGEWYTTGPALLHFTTEKTPDEISSIEVPSSMKNYNPVSVRFFDLPLSDRVIPGVFPSYFEQMKSLTDSESAFWMTKKTVLEEPLVVTAVLKMVKGVRESHPWTIAALAEVEDKWTKLLGINNTTMLHKCGSLSGAATAIPSILAMQAWGKVSRQVRKLVAPKPKPRPKDPVIEILRSFLGVLSEAERATFMSTPRGATYLTNIENDLKERERREEEASNKESEQDKKNDNL